MNEANVYPLHRIGCHDCGRPADWFCDGVTLPCRCGARDRGEVFDALTAARLWRPRTKSQVPARKREHVRSQAESEAWIDLLNMLGGLSKVAQQGKVSR